MNVMLCLHSGPALALESAALLTSARVVPNHLPQKRFLWSDQEKNE